MLVNTANELSVADQVSIDCAQADENNRPAFLYHLGDVVYSFGEAQYYYDQFYEPIRAYPAPILAIPGNHDSFIVPGTPKARVPLTTFQRNFCATAPMITPEAGSLHRTAMTAPGVYFTLDAPFVRVIGLFSNALEDPGVISNQSKKWSTVSDAQLKFLTAQLKRIKKESSRVPFCSRSIIRRSAIHRRSRAPAAITAAARSCSVRSIRFASRKASIRTLF